MFRYVCAAGVLCVVVAVSCRVALSEAAASAPAAGGEKARAELDQLVEKLKAEGEQFVQAKDDHGPGVSEHVKRLQYSEDHIVPLSNALRQTTGNALTDMYVRYQLLQPLKSAGNDTLRRVKAPLLAMLAQCQYKPMTQWPKATLAALNPPAESDPKNLMAQMEKINKLRQEKRQAEAPVVKYNRTVGALEQTVKKLLAMMADPQADEALLQRLAAEESSNSTMWDQTLEAIKGEVTSMDQARAKRLYSRLNDIARRVGVKKDYYDPTSPQYSETGNSGWRHGPQYFAVPVLTVVNLVAAPAREPAVKVPDVKAYEESIKPKG